MTVAAVIVAGGSGLRAGGERPKQYRLIGGKPMIWWSLKAFSDHPEIDLVQPVIGEGQEEWFVQSCAGLALAKPVAGGATRQESCRIGIEALTRFSPGKVLIHDAARPFVSRDIISAVIAELDRHEGVVPGMPMTETLKHAPEGIIAKTVDRAAMWTAQTPQGFGYATILAAHRACAADGIRNLTDDAAVAEAQSIAIAMIPGNPENWKVTSGRDLEEADRQLARTALSSVPDVRVGQGIDFHAFESGDAVILCGVTIPHTAKLKGHSDADAAMHALTDAILGAIGEGDIGIHFPPTQPQWRNAASSIFLEKAMRLIRERGGVIANADLTILAEAPRIAPHCDAMKAVLAPILGIGTNRIAIKSTTTEGLGAIGRGEGIAAFATVTVRLPYVY